MSRDCPVIDEHAMRSRRSGRRARIVIVKTLLVSDRYGREVTARPGRCARRLAGAPDAWRPGTALLAQLRGRYVKSNSIRYVQFLLGYYRNLDPAGHDQPRPAGHDYVYPAGHHYPCPAVTTFDAEPPITLFLSAIGARPRRLQSHFPPYAYGDHRQQPGVDGRWVPNRKAADSR